MASLNRESWQLAFLLYAAVFYEVSWAEPLHLPVLRKAPADLKPKRVRNGDFASDISTPPLTLISLLFFDCLFRCSDALE